VTRKHYWIGFFTAVSLVVVVSIGAYHGMIPSWVAPANVDKVLHFAMAGILAFFLDGALGKKRLGSFRFAPPIASLILVPIGIEEYMQRLSTVRTSSIADFLADTAGVTLASIAVRV
jgi:VanZ family protein